jgi:site-specific DNA-methyltransferase (adenine-specific)
VSAPYYSDNSVSVLHGDCLDILPTLPDRSVDAVVTDPPYSISFMSRSWDTHDTPAGFQQWCELWAAECLRVLKPGGHMLAFGGTRTWHRLVVAIEDAGFEMRDSIAWLYGSGFPKSLDVSKAIDKAAGAEREVIGQRKQEQGAASITRRAMQSAQGYRPDGAEFGQLAGDSFNVTAPATPAAQQWQGWGTALKPAFEPICVARKPIRGTVAANVQEFGTGALNIDDCRIDTNGETWAGNAANAHEDYSGKVYGQFGKQYAKPSNPAGRWPANVILDADQATALDEMSGGSQSRIGKPRSADSGEGWGMTSTGAEYDDQGGASRFFYTAKAGSEERITHNGTAHPTVKPLSLMRWLVRLVTPPGGTILEPFAGSGTTVEAALLEGFKIIAIEREADYLPLITQRIHRRRDPVAYLTEGGHDLGLFGDEDGAA